MLNKKIFNRRTYSWNYWIRVIYQKCVTIFIYTEEIRIRRHLLRKEVQGTAWKLSKYGAFSGPYFPLFGMNTKTTNTLFTHWEKTCDVQHITAYQNCRYDVVYSNENLSWNKAQLVLVFQTIFSINWKLSAFSFIRKA